MGLCATLALAGCQRPPEERIPRLDDFLPAVPAPGGAKGASAFRIGDDGRGLIAGTASTGRVGDYAMQNENLRVVIQQPSRIIGPQPYGGNVIDADLGPHGAALEGGAGRDQLGEMGLVYGLGRTFDFGAPQILADGSQGGPAALRFFGRDAVNDYINVRSLGLPTTSGAKNPDLPLPLAGAVTYILEPGAHHLRVLYTFFNTSDARRVTVPWGALADSGSEVELFAPGGGVFGSAFTGALSSLVNPAPFGVIQGQGVAYGLVPLFVPPERPSGLFVIGGVVLMLFGSPDIFGLIAETGALVDLPPHVGATYEMALVVAQDTSGVWQVERALRGLPAGRRDISGGVGDVVALDQNGAPVSTSLGTGTMVAPPGRYTFVAPGIDGLPKTLADVELAPEGGAPVRVEPGAFVPLWTTAIDGATGAKLPARVTVLGGEPSDARYGDVFEPAADVRADRFLSLGDDLESIGLVPGKPYRVVVSAGPEWSRHSQAFTAPAAPGEVRVDAVLRRVLDTEGYLACDFHQHAVGSPDSSVAMTDRVRGYLAGGVEYFASSDHDVLTDYRPTIAEVGGLGRVATSIGVEATPFDYGHFNFFPLRANLDIPGGGALDWAGGADGLSLPPGDIFALYRGEPWGARIVQVNHPRGGGGGLMAYFDKAGLRFDWAARTFGGDAMTQPIPNEILRLPEDKSLWSPTFDTLEIWTGVGAADTNGDGVLEVVGSDRVLADWFSLLAMGHVATAVGNSDTHSRTRDPPGMPRTYVRVPDDGPGALAGDPTSDIVRTLRGDAARDAIVTDGPFIRVHPTGSAASAIGGTVTAAGGVARLSIEVAAADWAPFDTVELFVNVAPDPPLGKTPTVLTPTMCFTARTPRKPGDPCDAAPLGGARPLAVALEDVPGAGGARRWAARFDVEVPLAMVPARPGARGGDAYIVVRARGNRALFPEIRQGVLDDAQARAAKLPILLGTDEAAIAAALDGVGVPAQAITNPIFIDGDGGGWKAPFSP